MVGKDGNRKGRKKGRKRGWEKIIMKEGGL